MGCLTTSTFWQSILQEPLSSSLQDWWGVVTGHLAVEPVEQRPSDSLLGIVIPLIAQSPICSLDRRGEGLDGVSVQRVIELLFELGDHLLLVDMR